LHHLIILIQELGERNLKVLWEKAPGLSHF